MSEDSTDALISARLRAPGYREWRALVQQSGGCAAPIHLTGSSQVLDRDGAVLIERTGDLLAPCGNRRASVCTACSDRYAADAFHLLRAGLAGDQTKGVPTSVAEHPRAFLTLTAPSFGPVHSRRVTPRGLVVPCGCGERHHGDDPRLGGALRPDEYDYDGAVLWQAHAAALWARFTLTLRRALAHALGVPVRGFSGRARLSYAKVAEYQRRGLVHFHAVVRFDGPDGPADPPPAGLNRHDVLADCVRVAARTATLKTRRPDGSELVLGWGTQLDLRPVTSSAARQLEDEDGALTDAALAGYIAKYATKGTGATEGADRRIREGEHIAYLNVTTHHRRMIETAWQLGGMNGYGGLRLRRWAHMLGFRGHFLTKSRAYSVTFGALRQQRRVWRLLDDLAALDRDTDNTPSGVKRALTLAGPADDTAPVVPDLDTITVLNHWTVVRIGHRDHAERELAVAVAERNRTQRRTRDVGPSSAATRRQAA